MEFKWEEFADIPWSLILTKSSGWREIVEAIPAVNPATVSTKDDDKPWPVMNLEIEVIEWLKEV